MLVNILKANVIWLPVDVLCYSVC